MGKRFQSRAFRQLQAWTARNGSHPPVMVDHRKLTLTQREELSDARLLLANAQHSVAAVLKIGVMDDDAAQALASALDQVTQVRETLARMR